jgi:hypothetical protein
MKLFFAIAIALFSSNIIAQSLAQPFTLTTKQVLKTEAGITARTTGFTCEKIIVTVDTSIKVAPTYAYLSIEFTNLKGGSQMDILNGSNDFYIVDSKGKAVLIKEKFLKKVNSAMGTNVVNMICKIPYKLKTDKTLYSITYQWQSKDKKTNIELSTKAK